MACSALGGVRSVNGTTAIVLAILSRDHENALPGPRQFVPFTTKAAQRKKQAIAAPLIPTAQLELLSC